MSFKVGDRVELTKQLIPQRCMARKGDAGIVLSGSKGIDYQVKFDIGFIEQCSETELVFERPQLAPNKAPQIASQDCIDALKYLTASKYADGSSLGGTYTIPKTKCECGSGSDASGPGHSSWCGLFRKFESNAA